MSISDQMSSSPSGALNDLITAFATWLPRDYKKTVILTFYIEKLMPSNLGGVLILSAMYTSVINKKMMQMSESLARESL